MSSIEELATALQAVGTLKAVGEQWISFDGSIPNGGIPFCGQIVTREMYPDLWNLMNKNGRVKTETDWQAHAEANGGTCPYYSSGDGSTTFRMPNVHHYLRAGNISEASTYKEESLPKGINLLFRFDGSSSSSPGAVEQYGNDGVTISYSETGGTDEFMINQSDLSVNKRVGALEFDPNIYKDGSEVTPKTYNVLVGVYAVGIVTNVGATELETIRSTLTKLEASVVKTVNNETPTNGNVNVSVVQSVNGVSPDEGGNVSISVSDKLPFLSWELTSINCGNGGSVTIDKNIVVNSYKCARDWGRSFTFPDGKVIDIHYGNIPLGTFIPKGTKWKVNKEYDTLTGYEVLHMGAVA